MGRVIPMKNGNGQATEMALAASIAEQNDVMHQLAAIFACVLRLKHGGKVFIPADLAAECYGQPGDPNSGWKVLQTVIAPLKTLKLQAYSPNGVPFFEPPKPVAPGSAMALILETPILQMLPPEVKSEIAALMDRYARPAGENGPVLVTETPEPPAPEPEAEKESTEHCGGQWHKDGVGLRCPDCGSKVRITEETLSA